MSELSRPPDPTLEFIFEARGGLADAIDIGPVPRGRRRVVPIGTGRFEGPRIRGQVMSGGADWQLVRTDGVAEVEAFYVLETDDGARIQVHNTGVRYGPPDVMQRLGRGEIVDPARYYFRAVPVFEAPPGPHAWLNRGIFICTGARYPNDIVLRFYRVT
jgi:hypothetical protein